MPLKSIWYLQKQIFGQTSSVCIRNLSVLTDYFWIFFEFYFENSYRNKKNMVSTKKESKKGKIWFSLNWWWVQRGKSYWNHTTLCMLLCPSLCSFTLSHFAFWSRDPSMAPEWVADANGRYQYTRVCQLEDFIFQSGLNFDNLECQMETRNVKYESHITYQLAGQIWQNWGHFVKGYFLIDSP